MLIGQGISKSFGGKEVLRHVNITIERRSITVIIGPSGGGKTTLLRALSLLDPPTSGTISIDGKEHKFISGKNHCSDKPPWPALTVVFQQLFLWPHLTLRQNISLAVQEREKTAHGEIDELIKYFEMEEFIDRYPNEASLGQKQRAAFVRAVVLKPKYLLLDEITSALDVEHVAKMLEFLKHLRDEGVGLFLITHLLRFAHRAADQVVFFNNGTITEAGPPSILDNPTEDRLRRFLSVIEAAS